MDDARTVEPSCGTRRRIEERTATESIVHSVAEVEGISPLHVTPPLDDVVDTDLLDRLFDRTNDGTSQLTGHVTFPYRGHEVTVHADGFVTIGPEAGP